MGLQIDQSSALRHSFMPRRRQTGADGLQQYRIADESGSCCAEARHDRLRWRFEAPEKENSGAYQRDLLVMPRQV